MFNGALLVDKQAGISSFGVIEALQKQWMTRHNVKKRDVPKLGHGGTLDPFATGLLIVCMGKALKLARYFLGSSKGYEGVIRFGETTAPGDPTAPITETSDRLPANREEIQRLATTLTLQPYLQTPPMYSAKKKDGKPLYELARQGIEVEREPKVCHLHFFEILAYQEPAADFRVLCSSGTYIRTLAQDLGRMAGSVALLEKLRRTSSGRHTIQTAMTLEQIDQATKEGGSWDELPCWIPFDRLLDSYDRAEATDEEARALEEGRQKVLFNILKRGVTAGAGDPSAIPRSNSGSECVAIYCHDRLVGIAAKNSQEASAEWGLERVFPRK